MILWAEPAGEAGTSNTLITSQEASVPGKFGERVFSKVRRFVVIREAKYHCSAL